MDKRALQSPAVIALVCLALAACTPARRTQLTIRIDADPSMRGDVRYVHVEVLGGASTDLLAPSHDEVVAVAAWPLSIALVPAGGDPTRVVRVTVEGRAVREGPSLATIHVSSGFVSGRTLVLDRRFEEPCRGVVCDAGTSCLGGRCVSSAVDPGLLPDLLADAGPLDAGPTPVDAWAPPVRAEGESCDPAAVTSVCAAGTACTCTGAQGCAPGAEPPRCWAFRDIGCARPIDLTDRVARTTSLDVTGDGTDAPDIVPGACLAAGGETVYLVRAPTEPLTLRVSATRGMEFWYGCGEAMSWRGCTGSWNFEVPRGGAAYILVEGAGGHRLRVERLP
jgi:hypothetical protein